jgi:hypothetical protein
MKLQKGLALAVLAGAAATTLAQSPQVAATVSYTLHWTNSVTGDQTPLAPGQRANMWLSALMTPGVGTVVTVSPEVFVTGNTLGTLRGIQRIFLDLVGTGGAEGVWTNLLEHEVWGIQNGQGQPAAGGARLRNIMAGQFPAHWSGVNQTNPIPEFWSGTWTPSNYSPRTVMFTTANGSANTIWPFASGVLVRDGSEIPVYAPTAADGFGSTPIPVVPSPSALALLAMGLLLANRRLER